MQISNIYQTHLNKTQPRNPGSGLESKQIPNAQGYIKPGSFQGGTQVEKKTDAQ